MTTATEGSIIPEYYCAEDLAIPGSGALMKPGAVAEKYKNGVIVEIRIFDSNNWNIIPLFN